MNYFFCNLWYSNSSVKGVAMRKGFTMVELLAVIVIMAMLIVLVIPGFVTVYSNIKRQNQQGKVSEIEAAALKYGSSIKDDIKNMPNSCVNVSIEYLIQHSYIMSEKEGSDVIMDPTTNSPLDGDINLCYCKEKFDIIAHYVVPFEQKKVYHEGDYVILENVMYKCLHDYTDGSGIHGTYVDEHTHDTKNYFEETKC